MPVTQASGASPANRRRQRSDSNSRAASDHGGAFTTSLFHLVPSPIPTNREQPSSISDRNGQCQTSTLSRLYATTSDLRYLRSFGAQAGKASSHWLSVSWRTSDPSSRITNNCPYGRGTRYINGASSLKPMRELLKAI
jgi:hypothetical protein